MARENTIGGVLLCAEYDLRFQEIQTSLVWGIYWQAGEVGVKLLLKMKRGAGCPRF